MWSARSSGSAARSSTNFGSEVGSSMANDAGVVGSVGARGPVASSRRSSSKAGDGGSRPRVVRYAEAEEEGEEGPVVVTRSLRAWTNHLKARLRRISDLMEPHEVRALSSVRACAREAGVSTGNRDASLSPSQKISNLRRAMEAKQAKERRASDLAAFSDIIDDPDKSENIKRFLLQEDDTTSTPARREVPTASEFADLLDEQGTRDGRGRFTTSPYASESLRISSASATGGIRMPFGLRRSVSSLGQTEEAQGRQVQGEVDETERILREVQQDLERATRKAKLSIQSNISLVSF
ncbi:unnamed protein product [Amoebophrya sp. A25]|nr:unnamed protein product [Amoebophrya sp. A25]|eukprot:GSA25T00002355001.1